MTWKKLLGANRLESHTTSKQELDDLRAAVTRNLHDAGLEGLSTDNKFGLAYGAGLLLGKMIVACAGYRVKGAGAHQTTFAALRLAIGPEVDQTAGYLDRCRRKRNELGYDAAGVATVNEAAELLTEVRKFKKSVEHWITKNHPHVA